MKTKQHPSHQVYQSVDYPASLQPPKAVASYGVGGQSPKQTTMGLYRKQIDNKGIAQSDAITNYQRRIQTQVANTKGKKSPSNPQPNLGA